MSGPTLGRLLKAELGERFVSANLPMLHTRTLDATGEAEFRPGVVTQADTIDLADEFERQFFGDVMLFSVERLTAVGFPQQAMTRDTVAAVLDTVHTELAHRYAVRHDGIVRQLAVVTEILDPTNRWWHAPEHSEAIRQFRVFLDNMQRNFGAGSLAHRRIALADAWPSWRDRLMAALTGLHADRAAWARAFARRASDA
jgi:hypothetical protein